MMLTAPAPAPRESADGSWRSSWLVRPRPRQQAEIDLVCFPHAGGGPSTFVPWCDRLPPSVELLAAQLPGREMRMAERPLSHVAEAAAGLGEAVAARCASLGRKRRLVFFGHSLGALLAFETARWLARRGEPGPRSLIVAGRRAPDLPLNRPWLHVLDDEAFLAAVQGMGGTPAGVLNDPRVVRMILPVLRADIGMNDAYQYEPGTPLSCRILALWGTSDPFATRAEIERWESCAEAGRFEAAAVPGGHFFVRDKRDQVIDVALRHLSKA